MVNMRRHQATATMWVRKQSAWMWLLTPMVRRKVGDTDGDVDGAEVEGDAEGDMVGEMDGETVGDVVGNNRC